MNYLDESNVKRKAGSVSSRSIITDPHVQKTIDYLAKETGKPKVDIIKHIEDKIKEYDDLKAKAPILYGSIAANMAEASIARLFQDMKVGVPKGCATFDPVTFSALIRRVKAENPSIFPLRNFYNKKPLAAPRIILVPSSDPKDKEWNKVDTAAATPNGEFIFNTNCAQDDMNFAFIRGIKPVSKKYKSNGGDFPDEWAPVEFTILHEFYHYTHGDFHMMKVLGGNPTIHNWAMDMRSNYDLQKAGHQPYVYGLFNDEVNYDRQGTYKEMYEIIKKEFEKLNPPQQKKAQKAMDEMGDNHGQHHGDGDPQGGGDVPSEEDAEKHGKKVSGKAGEGKDGAAPEKAGGEGNQHVPKADKGGRGGAMGQPRDVDYSAIKPRFDWKTLLAKLVRSADSTETTYQKVHRRNITSIHVATQTGAGVVRPGEKEVPANLVKLCLVIDSSGSMHENILKVFANIQKMFTENQSAISKSFVFIEFSSDFHVYNCTISGKSGSAVPIKGPADVRGGGSGEKISLQQLLHRHQGGGTNFNEALTGKIEEFIAQKYNVLIMTDSDILGTGNKETFMELFRKHHQNVYLILDSRATFTAAIQSMKMASANISHF